MSKPRIAHTSEKVTVTAITVTALSDIPKKRCSKCGETKPLSEYHKEKSHKDGRRSDCKDCKNKAKNERRVANPEKARKRERELWAANPERGRARVRKWKAAYPEKNRQQVRRWSASHPEKKHKNSQDWYTNNLERAIENAHKWKAGNIEKVRNYKREHRARKRQNGGQITIAEWQEYLDRYGYKCLCCGRDDVKLTHDHIVPLKLGGPNTIENSQLLCQSCNSKKGLKIIDYRR